MIRRTTVAIAFLMMGAACSGGASESAQSTAPEATAAATTVAADTTAPDQQTTTTQGATTTTTTTAPAAGFAAFADTLDDVAAITVSVEGTHRPRLGWASEAALDHVIVVISDADGGVLWAWGGQGQDVTVGAGQVDREGLGAFISEPGWAQVVGYDAAGNIIAISGLEPVG